MSLPLTIVPHNVQPERQTTNTQPHRKNNNVDNTSAIRRKGVNAKRKLSNQHTNVPHGEQNGII